MDLTLQNPQPKRIRIPLKIVNTQLGMLSINEFPTPLCALITPITRENAMKDLFEIFNNTQMDSSSLGVPERKFNNRRLSVIEMDNCPDSSTRQGQ
jgi:hypothetical protein